jgi:hypothetical protein
VQKIRWASIAALAFALFSILAGPAAARDRNHDRIPDRWEKRHHLSLKVNQARRDQDKDGLRNRAEFKARTDPRDDDTDNDGIEDGDEHAGTVAGFQNGVLTISLFGGGSLSGQVTDATEIECDDDSAHASDHGDDDNSGPNGDDEDNSGPGSGDDRGDDNADQAEQEPADNQGDDNDEQGEDENEDEECGTEALTTGRRVKEAELSARNGSAVFREVELGS